MPGSASRVDRAEEIDRHAADRRQKDFEVGPGHELGEHAARFFEQGAAQLGFGDREAAGEPRQVPDRVDRGLGDPNLAIVEQHLAIGLQRADGRAGAQLRQGDAGGRDRDRRAGIDTGADGIGKHLADEMPPRVERHDRCGIGPFRIGRDRRRRGGVGQVGAMVARQGPRRHGERTIDRIGAGIGADCVAPARVGRARHDRTAFGRIGRAPAQRDRPLTGAPRMRGEPDVARDRLLHLRRA